MHAVMHALCLVCEDPRVQLVFIRVQRPRKDVGRARSAGSHGVFRAAAKSDPTPARPPFREWGPEPPGRRRQGMRFAVFGQHSSRWPAAGEHAASSHKSSPGVRRCACTGPRDVGSLSGDALRAEPGGDYASRLCSAACSRCQRAQPRLS